MEPSSIEQDALSQYKFPVICPATVVAEEVSVLNIYKSTWVTRAPEFLNCHVYWATAAFAMECLDRRYTFDAIININHLGEHMYISLPWIIVY